LYDEAGVIEGASKELPSTTAGEYCATAVAGRWEKVEAGEEEGDEGAEEGGETKSKVG
jgi:hypothetical protein